MRFVSPARITVPFQHHRISHLGMDKTQTTHSGEIKITISEDDAQL